LAAEPSDLAGASAAAFAADGALARRDPGYVEREVQQRFAQAVAQALDERSTLVVEAGTGVGKTYAYLVPLLLAGRRALVSTATKSLQDQLFLRDLPRLAEALGVPLRRALLKGRSSYLCLHRLAQARQPARAAGPLADEWALKGALARVERWAAATRSGDLAELDGLDERSPVVPLVTSTRDNCLGSDCPRWRDCHLVAARREAMAADLVVVNHHLFFADLALRDSGVAELLPSVDAVVFDEAHQLVEAGVQFLGKTLASAAVLDFARDLQVAGLQHARGLRPWPELAAGCEHAARELRLAGGGAARGAQRRRWADVAEGDGAADFGAALNALAAATDVADEALAAVGELAPDFVRLRERAVDFARLARHFLEPADDEHVRWVDLGGAHLRLVESALDLRAMLPAQRAAAARAWVFTSATLGDDERLSWFTVPAGLDDARVLRLGSPFDHAAQSRLWVPQGLPRAGEPAHAAAVAAVAARCALRLGGRSFVLTTTLRVLAPLAQALRERLAAAGIEVLVQGEAPKRALLQRFVERPRAVLVGSHSFWEGIDVPGDALQCVLIDKLPFPPPTDPLVEARVRRIERAGGRAFDACFVAEAAVALKQGAGRLIRTETDRGLLVVCDERLVSQRYGARLRAALPPMPLWRDETQAMAWLGELASPPAPTQAG
jgi:ATP-dependent DNA helicase DinG